jgi:RecB family exonuclease
MHIILGYELDTGSYPDALGNDEARQGVVVLGPAGLVGVLETRLGLTRIQTHQAIRIGQYLKRLKEADNNERFYSKSIRVDAWSTAKQVLAWRDELVLAGWKGDVPGQISNRLQDLAHVEKLVHLEFAPGLGDRLQLIMSFLKDPCRLDIEEIRIVEPLASWPPCWRNLLDVLCCSGIRLNFLEEMPSPKDTDLGRLQKALINGRKLSQKDFQGDGSLCLISGSSEWELGQTLASWLQAYPQEHSKVLMIRGKGSPVLDDTLNAHNLPKLGYQSRSPWRTALQVLPLILSNYWEPFDPQRLLEILLLPKSPIRRKVARCFERALREHPGMNGPKWMEAWKDATAYYENDSELKDHKGSSRERIKRALEELRFWLGEERYEPDNGMPVLVIKEICSRVARWAASRGEREEDGLLRESASLARAVSDAVGAMGFDKVTRPQLDRILDSVVGEGLEHPGVYPQAARWSQVISPGQIRDVVDTLIWWNFTSPNTSPIHIPWTSDEKNRLSSMGVQLEEARHRRLREVNSWHLAVQHTSSHLVLMVPKDIAGERFTIHPIWDEIRFLLELNETDIKKIRFDAAHMWKMESPFLLGSTLTRRPLVMIPPPGARRVWVIPDSSACNRERESPSSMKKLIECPLAWVFQYSLRLYAGDLVSLPDGNRMMGTLSHAVIETIFSESSKWKPKDAEERALELLDEYIPRMAATLLHPGRELERERFRKTLAAAVRDLISQLASAKLRVKGYEVEKRRALTDAKDLEGRMDLILESKQGELIVLDLKWAGRAKYRRQELRDGNSLQLAAYGWLLEGEAGQFPPGGYYMLAQRELITSACTLFPDRCVFKDVDHSITWKRAVNAYNHRMQELEEQGIALAAGVSPDEMAPETNGHDDIEIEAASEDMLQLDPPCKWCSYANLCGARGRPE